MKGVHDPCISCRGLTMMIIYTGDTVIIRTNNEDIDQATKNEASQYDKIDNRPTLRVVQSFLKHVLFQVQQNCHQTSRKILRIITIDFTLAMWLKSNIAWLSCRFCLQLCF